MTAAPKTAAEKSAVPRQTAGPTRDARSKVAPCNTALPWKVASPNQATPLESHAAEHGLALEGHPIEPSNAPEGRPFEHSVALEGRPLEVRIAQPQLPRGGVAYGIQQAIQERSVEGRAGVVEFASGAEGGQVGVTVGPGEVSQARAVRFRLVLTIIGRGAPVRDGPGTPPGPHRLGRHRDRSTDSEVVAQPGWWRS